MFIDRFFEIFWDKIWHDLDPSLAKTGRDIQFLDNLGSLEASNKNVVFPIIGGRMRNNSSDTDRAGKFRFALIMVFPSRNQQRHCDQMIRFKRLRQQVTIARLENM